MPGGKVQDTKHQEENLTQRRKGAKVKTRLGMAAKEHKERKKERQR
jgi:hypothetical protein